MDRFVLNTLICKLSITFILKIKCGMCVFSFKREQHFEKHFNSLHAPHDKFPCTECVAKCSTEEVFKQHQDFHKTGFINLLFSIEIFTTLFLF